MSKIRIKFKITSGDLETAHSCDCQKWIRHLAVNKIKTDDLLSLFNGKFPSGKMFVLDMLEFLRKSDDLLDRFLAGRGGIKQDDHLFIEFDDVRQLLNREFPELVAQFANSEGVKKVIKRRPGTVDLSPLKTLGKKR
ncbi:MAG: hypothetical protein FD174_2463 [Geobacteraceae bacterium]|nr:MAG: hypothetical protein FD174_2463 [Geobacteraceae bacterium]